MSTRTEPRAVTQNVVVATICDACRKEAEGYAPDGWYYFMSAHGDWGNDSVESAEHWDVCSFACYLKIVRERAEDYGERDGTLEVDDKDLVFLRDMLAATK